MASAATYELKLRMVYRVSMQLVAVKYKTDPLFSRHSIDWLKLYTVRLSTQMFQKMFAALKIPVAVFFFLDGLRYRSPLVTATSCW